ncbi:MAG: peptide ABC transporter substrate-binding protein [bacterium]|nr:peptide ABC transporter substrate-binding protein [bacterium]
MTKSLNRRTGAAPLARTHAASRLGIALAAGALLALTAAGCQGDLRAKRRAAGEAAINIGATPRSLDPSLATDVASARAVNCLMRGLTTLDDQGNPRPELAESWTVSSDGRVWEFKLRPACWSNGEPITANDYVHAWTRRMLNPAFGAEYAYMLFYVAGARAFFENQALGPASVGVEAPAPDRLRVRLAAPTPYFLQLTAHQSYYPVCARVDQANQGWAQRPETYVASGPFTIEHYTPGDELAVVRNPRYWDAAHVALRRLTLRMIERESTARIAFDNGEIDGTDTVPRADLAQLRGRPELRFSPQFATYYVAINCQRPVLREVRVRRALALAIDRRAIVANVTRAGETPAFGMVPPALWSKPPDATFKDGAYDAARRLLAEAGYPGGRGLPELRYIFNTNEGHRQIAQVLQETWQRELGVRISAEEQEFKVTIDNRREGNFDLARAGWVGDFKDPLTFLEIFDSKSENNDSHWADPKYDALLAACRAEADPARRERLLLEAGSYLMQQMPAIPIYYNTSPYLATPEIEGYVINPMGMFDPARLAWKPPARRS